ncbi:YwmB family TATA-box binding protein [Aciduricibacillus chroicocephali]|uniref:YwmB family TATA-box binding protein n=1 Tax=Aciduricibacillus chroicocephali TaxID=3054939 RepID=A0ABY9KTG0_9BACI|nr:YwmB family TATA-box binding protein [Bacillaceae bacterium 44XB]
MKKAIILAGIACFVLIGAAWSQKEQAVNEIDDMAMLANELDMGIEEWRMTFKESIPEKKLYSIIDNIERYAKVTKTKGKKADKYFAENVHKAEGYAESFIVIVPSNGEQIELTIELRGEHWDEKSAQKYINIKNRRLNEFFTDSVKSFACLVAANDGIMDAGEILTKLKDKLNIKELTEQEENIGNTVNKKIFYGYIPLWPASLTIAEQRMNMQAVITNNKGSGSKLVIGTPILLHEY